MFRSARIKLTLWYLLIIMLISAFFSLAIYVVISRELERGFRRVELRLQDEEFGIILPPQLHMQMGNMHPLLLEDLKEAKQRVVANLVFANGLILLLSTIAGYFLAGKTLVPIEKTLEDQKRFIADASHELKTPLTALQTSIEVTLRDKHLNLKNAKQTLKENLEDIGSLGKLTADLLNLSRFQQLDNFAKEKINLKNTVENSIKKIKPLAVKNKIRLTSSLVDIQLTANQESIEKLITILLDNAVKYTPKGKVTVSVKKDNSNATLQVIDTGIGISKKELPHIFDRFYRVDASRSKADIPGFGLGLSLAKKIVDLHQGKIKVTSEPGIGSTFTVKLPLH